MANVCDLVVATLFSPAVKVSAGWFSALVRLAVGGHIKMEEMPKCV